MSDTIVKRIEKVKLKDRHKGHDVVKVQTRRRQAVFCNTCKEWIGARKLYDQL